MEKLQHTSNIPVNHGGSILVHIALALIITITFYPAIAGDFIWDDIAITQNIMHINEMSAANLTWAFTSSYAGHYQPLTWLSYMLDHEIWGMDPAGFHITNILLHILVCIFVYHLLAQLIDLYKPETRYPAYLLAGAAATLYAIHPMRVESVAWITERRDLLCGIFYIATIYYFLRDRYQSQRHIYYVVSLACFTLSLFAKAWGITLPVILFIIARLYDPRTTLPLHPGFIRNYAKIIGYLLPAFIFLIIARYAQDSAGAMLTLERHGISDRLLQLGYSISFYLYKTLLPLDLSPLYSLLIHDFYDVYSLIMTGFGIAITLLAIIAYRKYPVVSIVFFCYLIIILPVTGLAQSGPQLVADRYSYLATIPVYLLIVLAGYQLLRHTAHVKLFTPAVFSLTLLLAFLSHLYSYSWRNAESLWTHAVLQNPGNYPAWRNRGNLLLAKNRVELAHADFIKALDSMPQHAEAHYNLAYTSALLNRHESAIEHYSNAIRLFASYRDAYINRGKSHLALNRPEEALHDFEAALELDPHSTTAKLERDRLLQ